MAGTFQWNCMRQWHTITHGRMHNGVFWNCFAAERCSICEREAIECCPITHQQFEKNATRAASEIERANQRRYNGKATDGNLGFIELRCQQQTNIGRIRHQCRHHTVNRPHHQPITNNGRSHFIETQRGTSPLFTRAATHAYTMWTSSREKRWVFVKFCYVHNLY